MDVNIKQQFIVTVQLPGVLANHLNGSSTHLLLVGSCHAQLAAMCGYTTITLLSNFTGCEVQ